MYISFAFSSEIGKRFYFKGVLIYLSQQGQRGEESDKTLDLDILFRMVSGNF